MPEFHNLHQKFKFYKLIKKMSKRNFINENQRNLPNYRIRWKLPSSATLQKNRRKSIFMLIGLSKHLWSWNWFYLWFFPATFIVPSKFYIHLFHFVSENYAAIFLAFISKNKKWKVKSEQRLFTRNKSTLMALDD